MWRHHAFVLTPVCTWRIIFGRPCPVFGERGDGFDILEVDRDEHRRLALLRFVVHERSGLGTVAQVDIISNARKQFIISWFQALKPWALSRRVLMLSTCASLPRPAGGWRPRGSRRLPRCSGARGIRKQKLKAVHEILVSTRSDPGAVCNQRGFDRVNLHRHTTVSAVWCFLFSASSVAPRSRSTRMASPCSAKAAEMSAVRQGLTLVHFSARRQHSWRIHCVVSYSFSDKNGSD